LGIAQFVEIKTGLFVSNMIAQDRYPDSHDDGCAVDYEALKRCLLITFHRAIRWGYGVHMPAGMGSGLAGGNKDTVLQLIEQCAAEVESSEWSKRNNATLDITLWEFEDTASTSYVPPVNSEPEPESESQAVDLDLDDMENW